MTDQKESHWASIVHPMFLVAMLCLASGCGDEGGGSNDVPTLDIPPAITLLSDDFSSGNLSNWTIQAPAGQTSAFGNPAPSLLLDGLAGSGSAAVAYSNSSFLATGNLTLSLDVDPGNSNATVDIIESPDPPTIHTFASIVGTGVLYSIGGASKLINYPADGRYHRYAFTITSYGIGMWSRDGIVQHSGAYSAPVTVHLDLRDLAAGSTGSRFDNVLVTVP
jgi:hypothetical protein